MSMMIHTKEPTLALYLTTQYISELSRGNTVDLDSRGLERDKGSILEGEE